MDSNNSLSVFWVATEKIDPNPFQPRQNFKDTKLEELAKSIKTYGIIQPLVVTKKESIDDYGEMSARYELIAGERRWRASKIAGLNQVPVIIKNEVLHDNVRLELAIIENIQREDLNPIERARAFRKLVDDFNLSQSEIATKMNRSKEYVSNSLRLLSLPNYIIEAVYQNKISEGHTRPLLMLSHRQSEQETLFQEILNRNLTVRESEKIARKTASEKARKKVDPKLESIENIIEEVLKTRVNIQSNGAGGKIVIDYFSEEDLDQIVNNLKQINENSEGEDDIYSFKNFSL